MSVNYNNEQSAPLNDSQKGEIKKILKGTSLKFNEIGKDVFTISFGKSIKNAKSAPNADTPFEKMTIDQMLAYAKEHDIPLKRKKKELMLNELRGYAPKSEAKKESPKSEAKKESKKESKKYTIEDFSEYSMTKMNEIANKNEIPVESYTKTGLKNAIVKYLNENNLSLSDLK